MSNFNDNNGTEGNVLTIKTVQIAPFRTLMTALKDILLETNISFQPDGIRIINMDKSHTILAHLYLAAQNFEFYECKKEKIIIGVNMFHLFKLINSIDNDDTLSIYIENADYVDGIVSHLALKFENGEIKQCKTQKLRLIEPDPEELEYPDVKFSVIYLVFLINWRLSRLAMSLFLNALDNLLRQRFIAPNLTEVWGLF